MISPKVARSILLFIIGVFVYTPTFFGTFLWDDEDFVYRNAYVKEFRVDKFFSENAIAGRGKLSGYYRPIQLTLYAGIYKVFGFRPLVYHAASVLLHAIAAIILFLFLSTLLREMHVSFLTSLIFLVHPVQTESVSYISGISDPLVAIFMFLTLRIFIVNQHNMRSMASATACFILAVFSKELGLVTIGIMLLILVGEHTYRTKKHLIILGVTMLFGAAYYVLRTTVWKFYDPKLDWQGSMYGSSIQIRLATFFQNYFLYLKLLIFPKELFMERDVTISLVPSLFGPWTLVFMQFHLAVWILLILLLRRRHREARIASFLYVSFLVTLLPFTGIVLINGIFYEHFLYLPMIFFWGIVIWSTRGWLHLRVVKIVIFIYLAALISRSFIRQADWIDPVRFGRQTLTYVPSSIRAMNYLGIDLSDRGHTDEAVKLYEQGIRTFPTIANFYHNLAVVYMSKNQQDRAEQYFRQAISVDPSFYFSYFALASLYNKNGLDNKAKEMIEEVQRRFSNNPLIYHNYFQINN